MSENQALPTTSRREFLATVGAVAATAAFPGALHAATDRRTRYAIVGSGHRGTSMWGAQTLARHGDALELVGLCDINPLRAKAANTVMGTSAPVFTDLDEMLSKIKVDRLAVCTVDATHSGLIAKALARGVDVITEKPMATEVDQIRTIIEAEKTSGRPVAMGFNYRYSPKHEKTWSLLRTSDLGKVISVDFSWYLDVFHGADYFRRWHRLKNRSGSLLLHKASHHFDLMNWWLGADPVEVEAVSSLRRYGRNGTIRGTSCRTCPHKTSWRRA